MTIEDKIELERAQYGNARVNHLFELGLEFENLRMTATELWDDDLTEVIEDLFSGELEMHKRESLIIEHNQKMTEEEAWKVIAENHGLKSAAQASNVFTQGKVNVWPEINKFKDKNETPELTPEHIKALGVACGTIQRLFSEGFREGLKEVSE